MEGFRLFMNWFESGREIPTFKVKKIVAEVAHKGGQYMRLPFGKPQPLEEARSLGKSLALALDEYAYAKGWYDPHYHALFKVSESSDEFIDKFGETVAQRKTRKMAKFYDWRA
jgi:hypothetical protein